VIRVEVRHEEVLDVAESNGLDQLTLGAFPTIEQQLIAAAAQK
jgi:hypothetical protein